MDNTVYVDRVLRYSAGRSPAVNGMHDSAGTVRERALALLRYWARHNHRATGDQSTMNVISQITWQPANTIEYPNTYLWYGLEEATEADVEALEKHIGKTPEIETGTLIGRLSPIWRSRQHPLDKEGARPGGIRSRVYENQYVDPSEDGTVPDNVRFTDKLIWHYNSDGKLVKEIPINGYHERHVGDGYYDNFAGPRPGSQAEAILGDGNYVWDGRARLWRVE